MDVVPDIKARIDVVDLVAEYVSLKPAGAGSFKGNCPFHQERTPSFHVSRTRQSWHCFGCDIGGDIFSFVERVEGMEFREALAFLAQKAGVALPEPDGRTEAKTKKKRLHEVNELAARFFRAQLLQSPAAAEARAYVAKRRIDDLSADLFMIGFAPESWSSLTDALARQGVAADDLVAAGLAMKRERGDGVYDRFRGRLMFPINDLHGNTVGFTGRIMTVDPEQPKYMNTPETAVYRKSALLYGLDKAKAEIRRAGLAVIVEGNMDVVSSHQAGISNVVAASGTALTTEQLSLLKRFSTNLAIAFDQDAAGAAATLRGLDLARVQEFSIRIITLPPEAGKDPDEACKKDPFLWKQAIEGAQGIMDWVYRRAFARHAPSDPEGKRRIADEALPEIARIPHPVERDAWIRRLAQDLQIGEDALRQGLKRSAAVPAPVARPAADGVPAAPEPGVAERVFFLSLVEQPLFEELLALGDDPDELRSESGLLGLYTVLREAYHRDGFSPSAFPAWSRALSHLETAIASDEMKNIFHKLSHRAEDALSSGTLPEIRQDHAGLLRRLRKDVRTRKLAALAEAMRHAEITDDTALVAELGRQYADLIGRT